MLRSMRVWNPAAILRKPKMDLTVRKYNRPANSFSHLREIAISILHAVADLKRYTISERIHRDRSRSCIPEAFTVRLNRAPVHVFGTSFRIYTRSSSQTRTSCCSSRGARNYSHSDPVATGNLAIPACKLLDSKLVDAVKSLLWSTAILNCVP